MWRRMLGRKKKKKGTRSVSDRPYFLLLGGAKV